MPEFVHLHVHSYYSLLDGNNSPAELAAAAAEVGMPALALTDHDALYGAVEFYEACREVGVEPIVGMELTLDIGLDADYRNGRTTGGPRKDCLVLLAENMEGYANLCRLSSVLQTDADRESALERGLDPAELEGRTGGLIVLSGGKRAQLDRLVRAGRMDEAEALAASRAERFGRGRYFIELQIQAPGDAQIAVTLAGMARRLGLQAVATNNVHYLAPEGAGQCRLLAAMRTLQPLSKMPD